MVDFILAGLSAGLFAFAAFFMISFVTLGLSAGVYRLLVSAYRALFEARASHYREQTA